MKKISKILFPTDFSDSSVNAFRYALWFADRYGAAIELWHFVSPELAPSDIPVVSGELTQQKVDIAKDVMKTFINTGMTQVQTAHELSNVPVVHGHVEVGAPSRYIYDKANDVHADLIIMGTQGEHNTIERIFGSVTTATIRKAHCPVLAVPDHITSEKITTVAYATDLKESDPYHIWEVIKLLSPFDSKFRVVHIEEKSSKDEQIELNDLRQFFKDNDPSTEISFHNVLGNDNIDLLDNFISHHNADLMIMYKPNRTFFERLFHSSLTRRIALHSSVPLLVLK